MKNLTKIPTLNPSMHYIMMYMYTASDFNYCNICKFDTIFESFVQFNLWCPWFALFSCSKTVNHVRVIFQTLYFLVFQLHIYKVQINIMWFRLAINLDWDWNAALPPCINEKKINSFNLPVYNAGISFLKCHSTDTHKMYEITPMDQQSTSFP